MIYFRAAIVLILLSLIPIADDSKASIQNNSVSTLKVRAWQHLKYLRIVLEGADELVSKGRVSRNQGGIEVVFDGFDITVINRALPFSLSTDKNVLRILLKKPGDLKTFSLKDPSRIVIDVYDQKQKSPMKENKSKKAVKKDVKKETLKTGKKEAEKGKEKDNKETAKKETTGKDAAKKATADAGIEKEGAGEKEKDKKENKPVAKKNGKESDESGFIPDEYKALWNLLQAGNFYTVLKELPNFEPKDVKSLAAYHYMYGDAYRTAQQYLTAIEHLRLAYIYAMDESLKERALFERAELYEKLGLLYESRANYLVFLKEFPGSARLKQAHLGLAETLSDMSLYSEAVKHYKKAGDTPDILFSKANTLQRIGRVSQARRAYADALLVDAKYPSRSPETYFFIGENMRMLGELDEAKRHLRSLGFGEYKDESRLSLGHIAMEESDMEEAIKNFRAAAKSNKRKVMIEGLFNLSKALVRTDRLDEAMKSLETIRNNYINSALYKDTLLELSRVYRKKGRVKESVSLLKELVYGKLPPKEAFKELESILLEVRDSADGDSAEELKFVTLWREVGQWLIDATREEFLIKVSEKLRSEGEQFIKLSTWIVENASSKGRVKAAVDLADYYVGIGDVEYARQYMKIADKAKTKSDASLRVAAKILHATGEYDAALRKLMGIKKYAAVDLDLVGSIITKLTKTEERLEAVAFYEKVLKSGEWEAESYNLMADLLYTNDEKNKALKYYRIALLKEPEDEWAAYRIGEDAGAEESRGIFSRLEMSDSLLGRLAKTKLMEIDLLNKVKEVY